MKQKNILIVIAILIVLIVSLFIMFYPKEKSAQIKGYPCSDEFYEALNKSNISLCEFTTPDKGDNLTGTMSNPYYNNYCREFCVSAIAQKKGDSQLCKLINPFKDIPRTKGWDDPRETGSVIDHCYIGLAQTLDNVNLCNNVETDWAKAHCFSIYESNKNDAKAHCSSVKRTKNPNYIPYCKNESN